MLDDWFHPLELKITWAEFQKLPRNPAYRHEFYGERAVLSGRPRTRHAVLDLSLCDDTPSKLKTHPVTALDFPQLVELFTGAFSNSPPFFCLSDGQKLACATELLQSTFDGKDGPIVEDASFIIRNDEDGMVGAILVTLQASDDFGAFDPIKWNVPAPDDAVAQGWGVPHLTWVFVAPFQTRCGIAQSLLMKSALALRTRGYEKLYSTFLVGNHQSMLWHWKMGFQLIESFESKHKR